MKSDDKMIIGWRDNRLNFISLGISTITLLSLILLPFSKKENSLNVAYVNTVKVVQSYKGMEEVKKLVEGKTKEYQAEIDTLISDFEKEVKTYERNRSKMTDKEKQLTEKLLQNKQQQFMRFKDASMKKMKEEEMAINQRIIGKLDEFMKEYARQRGYDFVFGATSDGNILFGAEALNITDDVIKEANKSYESKK